MRILMSNNPDNLRAKLAEFSATATVEAEFGNTVVEGSVKTLAHHAIGWRHFTAPCNRDFDPPDHVDAIGVSHFDLDCLGGVLAVMGRKPEAPEFWAVAAWVDTRGPQRVTEHPDCIREVMDELNAFWAWSQRNRLFPPRDGSVQDVTDFFEDAARNLKKILNGDTALIRQGKQWADSMQSLNAQTFRDVQSWINGLDVIIRVTPGPFVNSMYNTPDGRACDAVIALNELSGAITLSFERSGLGDACEIMQRVFGPEAGGHVGIAGTPRDKTFTFEDIKKIIAEKI